MHDAVIMAHPNSMFLSWGEADNKNSMPIKMLIKIMAYLGGFLIDSKEGNSKPKYGVWNSKS